MKKIGIIGAMEVEVKMLFEAMTASCSSGKVEVTQLSNLIFYSGKLCNIDVVVVRSGIGKVNAALCAQRLIIDFNVTHIINTGIAGAMESGLCVFDVVVSTDAVYHDFDVTGFGYNIMQIPQMDVFSFQADKNLIDIAKNAFYKTEFAKKHKVVTGRVATGDQFISNAEKKYFIKKICNPSCVEMEGAAIAHTCYLNNIPFVIIRSMSDTASDENEYSFNEKIAANESASLVLEMLKLL